LAPGETATVSYTVKVTAAPGEFIEGDSAYVCGVKHGCRGIYVRRTLSESEQSVIIEVIEQLRKEGTKLTMINLVNEIYKRAFNVADVFKTTSVNDIATGGDGVFVSSTEHKIGSKASSVLNPNESAYYRQMLADGLYGGYRVYSGHLQGDRTRLLKEHNLVVGDILIGRTSSAERVYIYIGNSTFLNLTDGIVEVTDFSKLCENILYYGRDFAVLRPSAVMN
jgi:hypothetical protein